jgi:hypothetical protein
MWLSGLDIYLYFVILIIFNFGVTVLSLALNKLMCFRSMCQLRGEVDGSIVTVIGKLIKVAVSLSSQRLCALVLKCPHNFH